MVSTSRISRALGCAAFYLTVSDVPTLARAIVANRGAADREALGTTNEDFNHVAAWTCHHRTGAILLNQIAASAHEVLGEKIWVYPGNQHHKVYYSGNRVYSNFDKKDYLILKSECKNHTIPYRMVHVIRDPIHWVASAYWFHTKHPDDTSLVYTDGHKLANLSLRDGLDRVAGSMKLTILQDMEEVYDSMALDTEVMTVSLEDFSDDYDNTVRGIYKWFLGDGHPQMDHLVEAAAQFDAKRHPEGVSRQHATSADEHLQAKAIIKEYGTVGVWEDLRQLRRKLGFVEVLPETWRLDAEWKTKPTVADP